MPPNQELCCYRYDPLDRLMESTPAAQATAQRFYQKERLATELQSTVQRSIMQHDDQLLAQQTRQASTAVQTSLLVTDQQRSVLNVQDATQAHPLVYMPYGHRLPGNGLLSLLGFNGERPDPVTRWYLLGTGYHRPFNPVLMRFICPDSWSPFGWGGFNAYAYCAGDPVNKADKSGHMFRRVVSAGLELAERIARPGASELPHAPILRRVSSSSDLPPPFSKHQDYLLVTPKKYAVEAPDGLPTYSELPAELQKASMDLGPISTNRRSIHSADAATSSPVSSPVSLSPQALATPSIERITLDRRLLKDRRSELRGLYPGERVMPYAVIKELRVIEKQLKIRRS